MLQLISHQEVGYFTDLLIQVPGDIKKTHTHTLMTSFKTLQAIKICCYNVLILKFIHFTHKKGSQTSLVVQWLRIRLPMQGTRVRALVREDPTCRGAAKPVCHNYWSCALEPASHNYWARAPQLLKPACPEPMLHNKRSHRNEKPMNRNEE